jgi:hypothetical protein
MKMAVFWVYIVWKKFTNVSEVLAASTDDPDDGSSKHL